MSRYTIVMDYTDFQNFQKKENELMELRNKILSCMDYEPNDQPILVYTKKLKEVALSLLPFEIEDGEEVIDV